MPWTEIRVFCEANGDVPLMEWLTDLQKQSADAFEKALAHIGELELNGYELRRPAVDSIGDGIRELRWRCNTVQYRILFFYSGKNVVVLSHGLTKEKKIPPADKRLAIKRMNLVESDSRTYTATFDV